MKRSAPVNGTMPPDSIASAPYPDRPGMIVSSRPVTSPKMLKSPERVALAMSARPTASSKSATQRARISARTPRDSAGSKIRPCCGGSHVTIIGVFALATVPQRQATAHFLNCIGPCASTISMRFS